MWTAVAHFSSIWCPGDVSGDFDIDDDDLWEYCGVWNSYYYWGIGARGDDSFTYYSIYDLNGDGDCDYYDYDCMWDWWWLYDGVFD